MKPNKPQKVIRKSSQVGASNLYPSPSYYDLFALWERAEWWEFILDGETGDYRIFTYGFSNVEELDSHVKEKYAEELKHPEVIARIIGSNEII